MQCREAHALPREQCADRSERSEPANAGQIATSSGRPKAALGNSGVARVDPSRVRALRLPEPRTPGCPETSARAHKKSDTPDAPPDPLRRPPSDRRVAPWTRTFAPFWCNAAPRRATAAPFTGNDAAFFATHAPFRGNVAARSGMHAPFWCNAGLKAATSALSPARVPLFGASLPRKVPTMALGPASMALFPPRAVL